MQEELYNDFTTKLLPKIQEGLVISQEYFLDLFGRYVNYLIVKDITSIVIELIVLVVCVWFWIKLKPSYDSSDFEPPIVLLLCFILGFVMIIAIISGIFDLIKVFYVPEVRIYEEFSRFNQ